MIRLSLMVAALCSAGCRDQARAPTPTANATMQAANTQSEGPARAASGATVSLAGAWRVARINGLPVDEPNGLALTANADKLWWEPRCAGMARSYRIKGASISFGSLEAPRAPGEPTPPVCAIGLPPGLREVFVAIDNAETITRTAGGLDIAGDRNSIMLSPR